MKRVYVNEQWCLGCHLCEYNCAYANSGLSNMVKALKDKRIFPRIRVEDTGKVTYALSCRHCTDPLCVKSCISGAMHRGTDGAVRIDREKCVGCFTCMQGCCAGKNMAGGSAEFDNAIVMNAIGFFGLHSLTAGSYDGEMYERATDESVKRLYFKDNRLAGFILIGDIAGAGVYTSMIRNKTPINTVNLKLLENTPALSAFNDEYRGKMLREVI